MNPWLVRFEQRQRGHFMVLERDPPLVRQSLDETQLYMLKNCDVPGLLPIETDEMDGRLLLRYALTGTRMLAEIFRSSKWSMTELMEALCRLAEVLEECRLYLLDSERIMLEDEFIFVGNDCHDLRFTYAPLNEPLPARSEALERLVVRWMLKVDELDGKALQIILRLVASNDFMPAALRGYARQYLSGCGREADKAAPVLSSLTQNRVRRRTHEQEQEPEPKLPAADGRAQPSRIWQMLSPPTGEPHSLSGLLDDQSGPWDSQLKRDDSRDNAVESQMSEAELKRWRIIVVCTAVLAVALAWKFVYLAQPNEIRLLVSACLTLLAGAGTLMLWGGRLRRRSGQREYRPVRESDVPDDTEREAELDAEAAVNGPRFSFPRADKMPQRSEQEGDDDAEAGERVDFPTGTGRLSSGEERTTLLGGGNIASAAVSSYFLIWESKGEGTRIELSGSSLVIGRSPEAAGHTDDSAGISRTHAELILISGQWKVKDLGSRNGSRLNDRPMAPYEMYPLQAGDRLTLAQSRYRFVHEKKP